MFYQIWVFTFAGCGAHKYAGELLELVCNFTFEFPPALQLAQLNNWLVSVNGTDCFPFDLVQEHHILNWKTAAQRSNTMFGSDLSDLISRNVRNFNEVKKKLPSMLNLAPRSASHRVKQEAAAKSALALAMQRSCQGPALIRHQQTTMPNNRTPINNIRRQYTGHRPGEGVQVNNAASGAHHGANAANGAYHKRRRWRVSRRRRRRVSRHDQTSRTIQMEEENRSINRRPCAPRETRVGLLGFPRKVSNTVFLIITYQ